ncbi:hypothetical protein COCCADRAFT_41349 [Bipolaris zeicola 26-R-13]|uniref:Carrier domain-containing protein n=1 Tax=Cochliobolus carbonum (strain 26-R-13) TaxID=930089 RepID=W6YA79_COCC2|nr:uncharacterized protein COCCADRAFT_41349 [Bipolaris zeicola 26-R-13]EUC28066.1 hypothetical protein COCCADRAFT_41349 [Bipolaris zeicola 26-R-13]
MFDSTSAERTFILSSIAKALGVPAESIDTSKCFIGLGGHSLSAVEVQHACKAVVSKPPTVFTLLTSPSIEALLPGDGPRTREAPAKPELISSSTVTEYSQPSTTPSSLSSLSQSPSRSLSGCSSVPDGENVEDALPSEQSGIKPLSVSNEESAPATGLQAAFIHSGQSTIHYFETWSLEDLPFITYAWKRVLAMEPMFSTRFEEAGQGRYVMRKRKFECPWTQVVTFDRTTYEEELARREGQVQPTFVFKTVVFKGVGSKSSSGRRRESEATIMISIHHALLDGFAMERLAVKVRRVAAGEVGVGAGKSFLTAAKEIEALAKEQSEAATRYWQSCVREHTGAATETGLQRPKGQVEAAAAATKWPTIQGKKRNEVNVNFEHLSELLREKSRELGVTVAAFFHAAWAVVQATYADVSQVKFGTIMSGRNLPIDGIDTVIGPILNSLPFYANVDEAIMTDEFVQNVFNGLVELSCYQWSAPEHGLNRDFEAALSVTRGIDRAAAGEEMQPLRPVQYDFESSIPLSLALDEAMMSLRVVYHADRYAATAVEDMAMCFATALERLAHSTPMHACKSALVTVPMQMRLRVLGNCISGSTTRAAHMHEDLVSMLDAAARTHAEAVAVEVGNRRITYAELHRLTARTATALGEAGVKAGEVVCVHADGSLEWIVGLLGALQADAVFCSLDATLPHELRRDMFGTAGGRVFVVGHEWQRELMPDGCAHLHTPQPLAPAYLCFTSGSTGRPKGVVCTHQALIAFQADVEVRLHANPGVRIAQFMSPAFDGSIHEIFSTLCYGATLVLRDPATLADPFDVLRRVSSAIMTPSVARCLSPADFANLETVYLVGEQVPHPVVDKWATGGRKLYNMYGPTEGTGGATITRLRPTQPVTIGHPNPTSRLYILGRNGCLLPPGAVGEIYIAGVQIALGYASMPDHTAACFVPDTICPGLGETMYQTGDYGYWDHNGHIVCLGRRDRQLKLRGFRLDLDDLETRILKALPHVKAVALTRSQKGDSLVAVIQPATLSQDEVRNAMLQILPKPAVPSAIACVDAFPLTRVGKVDSQAIAASFPAH